MTRRRQRRRAAKERRHNQPQPIVREATHVERLAYTRTQAAEALGISRSTFDRLLPYIETVEMPWGAKLIPIDELERILSEHRQAARVRPNPPGRGRPPVVPRAVAERIHTSRAAGKTLGHIAADLNNEGVPTAHGGTRWWPSTVRSVLQRPSRQSHNRSRAPR
jgi:hypothetical protein